MALFCIFSHPQLPLVRISIEPKRKNETRDGFVLRYMLEIPKDGSDHADDVIHTIDDAMGKCTRAHGLYQTTYEVVKATYDDLLADAMADRPIDYAPVLRAAAVIVATLLTIAMSVILPLVTMLWLFISAIKNQSGIRAMAESAIVWSIFDWRPLIHKLFHYANTGVWPK